MREGVSEPLTDMENIGLYLVCKPVKDGKEMELYVVCKHIDRGQDAREKVVDYMCI